MTERAAFCVSGGVVACVVACPGRGPSAAMLKGQRSAGGGGLNCGLNDASAQGCLPGRAGLAEAAEVVAEAAVEAQDIGQRRVQGLLGVLRIAAVSVLKDGMRRDDPLELR